MRTKFDFASHVAALRSRHHQSSAQKFRRRALPKTEIAQKQAHSAVFTPAEPIDVDKESELVVVLDHQFEFGYPGFSIGRFRLSVTSDDNPSLDASIPDAILAVIRTAPEGRTADQQTQLLKHIATIAPVDKADPR